MSDPGESMGGYKPSGICTFEEVAEQFGISRNTAINIVTKFRRRLRTNLIAKGIIEPSAIEEI